MLVCALGDLLLDVIVRTDGSSGPDVEGTAETRVGAGGQAANVAAWVVVLGAQARFVGKRAADGAGELAARELSSRGVELLGPVDAEGRNGVVVSLVDPEGARTMLSDRGVAPMLRAEDLDVRWFGGCEWLHLSGYSLFRRPIDEAAAKATGAVQAQGGRVSIDLSSAAGIRSYGPDRLLSRLGLLQPDIVYWCGRRACSRLSRRRSRARCRGGSPLRRPPRSDALNNFVLHHPPAAVLDRRRIACPMQHKL